MDEPAKRVRSSENFFVKDNLEKKINSLLRKHCLERPGRPISDILSKATQQFLSGFLESTSNLVKSRKKKSKQNIEIVMNPRKALDEWKEEYKQRREEYESTAEIKTKRKRDDYDKGEDVNDLLKIDLQRKKELLREESQLPIDITYRISERDVKYMILMESYKFRP